MISLLKENQLVSYEVVELKMVRETNRAQLTGENSIYKSETFLLLQNGNKLVMRDPANLEVVQSLDQTELISANSDDDFILIKQEGVTYLLNLVSGKKMAVAEGAILLEEQYYE